MGLTSQQEIKNYLSSRDSINDKIKDVLFNLGYKDTAPAPEHQALYLKWTNNWGMDHEVILLACRQAVRKKSRTNINQVDEILTTWKERGFVKTQDIKNYLREKKILIDQIKAVLDRAGDNREVTASDQKLFIKWIKEWNMPYELVLLAAEYSTMAENKLPFINKILSNWHNMGIKTVKEAKADHDRHVQGLEVAASKTSSMKKEVDFTQFEQHSYTDEELEELFEDIENA